MRGIRYRLTTSVWPRQSLRGNAQDCAECGLPILRSYINTANAGGGCIERCIVLVIANASDDNCAQPRWVSQRIRGIVNIAVTIPDLRVGRISSGKSCGIRGNPTDLGSYYFREMESHRGYSRCQNGLSM